MVRVDDEDPLDSNDLIDRVVLQLHLSPNMLYMSTITHVGIYGRAIMRFKFRFTCQMHYYGSNCATFCTPQDSDQLGHYTCDSDGRRVCMSGYTGADCLTGTYGKLFLGYTLKRNSVAPCMEFLIIGFPLMHKEFIVQLNPSGRPTLIEDYLSTKTTFAKIQKL